MEVSKLSPANQALLTRRAMPMAQQAQAAATAPVALANNQTAEPEQPQESMTSEEKAQNGNNKIKKALIGLGILAAAGIVISQVVKGRGDKATQNIAEAGEKIAENLGEKASEAGEKIAENLGEKASEAGEKIAENLGEKASEAGEKIAEDLGEKAGEAGEKIAENLGEKASEASERIAETVSEAIAENADLKFTGKTEAEKDLAKRLVGALEKRAEDLANDPYYEAYEALKTPAKSAKESAKIMDKLLKKEAQKEFNRPFREALSHKSARRSAAELEAEARRIDRMALEKVREKEHEAALKALKDRTNLDERLKIARLNPDWIVKKEHEGTVNALRDLQPETLENLTDYCIEKIIPRRTYQSKYTVERLKSLEKDFGGPEGIKNIIDNRCQQELYEYISARCHRIPVREEETKNILLKAAQNPVIRK